MIRFIVLTVVSLALAHGITLSPSVAHDGATGVIKERMEAMKGMRERVKTIAKFLKGEQPMDAERIARLAEEIGNHGGEAMIAKFPEGSIEGPSEAVPQIWEDWERFETLALDLSRQSKALADQISSNPDELPINSFKALAGTCKSCHEDFRKRK